MSTIKAWVGWAAFGWLVLSASTAWAAPGTIVFTNGARLEGDIIRYEAGQPVTIRTPDGSEVTYRAEDVQSVELSAQPPAAPAATSTPAPAQTAPPPVTAPTPVFGTAGAIGPEVAALLQEKQRLKRWRRARLGGPIILLAVGTGVLALGAGIFAASNANCEAGGLTVSGTFCDEDEFTPGMAAGTAFMVVGGVLFITGAAVLPGRLIRRKKRKKRLREIDEQLASKGVTASLTPMLPVRRGDPYGLRLVGTF